MAFIGLDLSKNLSFYTLPAAFFLALVPNIYAIVASGKHFDLAYPNSLQNAVNDDSTMGKKKQLRIVRAKAAANNAFETMGFYAAAVVAANVAKVDNSTLNTLTLSYIVSRMSYTYVYVVLGENRNSAPLRTVVWWCGAGLTLALWIKAGNRMG